MMDGMSDEPTTTIFRSVFELKDLPGRASVTVFDGVRSSRIHVPGGRIESVQIVTHTLTEYVAEVVEGCIESSPAAGTDLAEWLDDQAQDETLEAAMMAGSLDTSPFQALMAELIRRAP